MAAGVLVVTTGLALAESPYGTHDYWSRVERAQECAWGGGRAYYVDNPQNIPQIFRDETELALKK